MSTSGIHDAYEGTFEQSTAVTASESRAAEGAELAADHLRKHEPQDVLEHLPVDFAMMTGLRGRIESGEHDSSDLQHIFDHDTEKNSANTSRQQLLSSEESALMHRPKACKRREQSNGFDHVGQKRTCAASESEHGMGSASRRNASSALRQQRLQPDPQQRRKKFANKKCFPNERKRQGPHLRDSDRKLVTSVAKAAHSRRKISGVDTGVDRQNDEKVYDKVESIMEARKIARAKYFSRYYKYSRLKVKRYAHRKSETTENES